MSVTRLIYAKRLNKKRVNNAYSKYPTSGLVQGRGNEPCGRQRGTKRFYCRAGQGAYDESFQLIGAGDYFVLTMQAFRNLERALAAVGTRQVISSTIYMVGLNAKVTEQFVAAMNQAPDGQPFPPNAPTLVGVLQLAYPHMLVERSVIAALD